MERLLRHRIVDRGKISREFLDRGLADMTSAVAYVRSSLRTQFRPGRLSSGVPGGKGTCSTKHALLACLAQEQGIPLELTLGIYEMNERNTPGTGRVLARHGLDALPEAHCYLKYGSCRLVSPGRFPFKPNQCERGCGRKTSGRTRSRLQSFPSPGLDPFLGSQAEPTP